MLAAECCMERAVQAQNVRNAIRQKILFSPEWHFEF